MRESVDQCCQAEIEFPVAFRNARIADLCGLLLQYDTDGVSADRDEHADGCLFIESMRHEKPDLLTGSLSSFVGVVAGWSAVVLSVETRTVTDRV